MDTLTLSIERPDAADVRAMLQRHFDLMRANSPEESCHVMEPDALSVAGITLLGVRRNGMLLGTGALSEIGQHQGELKSMHTAAEARGQGVARKLLRALIDHASNLRMVRVSLETGTAPTFAAARALYASEGFVACAPFGDYVHDPLSTYMTKEL